MASRRDLKKNVNYISDMVAGLCIIEGVTANTEKQELLSSLLSKCLAVRKETISRISHTEPGNVKGFYKKLKSDFNASIDEIFTKLQGAE